MIATSVDMLAPLLGDVRVVEGGDEGHRAVIALREALASGGNCTVESQSAQSCSAHVMTVEGTLIVHASTQGWLDRLLPRRYGEAARGWRAMWGCIDREVPCARPVALLAATGFSYLVIERASAVFPLTQWLGRERTGMLAGREAAAAFVSALAAFVARVHRAGVLPRGSWFEFVGVRPTRAGARFEFQLLELRDGPAETNESKRLENLAELSLDASHWSRTFKLRFFREYRGLFGEEQPERAALRIVAERARQLRFDANTLLVAHCAEATAMQAVVRRDNVLLLLNRNHTGRFLTELEAELGKAAPESWEAALAGHFERHAEEGAVCRFVWAVPAGDDARSQRRLEGTWGRLLELDAVGARAPLPLACCISEGSLCVLGWVDGRLESLTAHRHDRDWRLIDELAHELKLLHDAGLFVLPGEVSRTAEALGVSVREGGSCRLVWLAPDQLFRGTPSLLGTQAVASLGRAAHAVGHAMGERALKELVWTYARALCLNSTEAAMLLEETARVPTGRTLVVTRGLERARVLRGARN